MDFNEILVELAGKRKALEAELAALTSECVNRFFGMTIISPRSISINMVEITTMADLTGNNGHRYVVGSVDVDLAL